MTKKKKYWAFNIWKLVIFSLEKTDYFRYLQTRDYYTRTIKMDKATEQSGIIKAFMDAYKGKMSWVISALYQALLKSRGNLTLFIKEKWEQELEIEMTGEEWYDICKMQHSTTGSRVWRKNIIRFFITPKNIREVSTRSEEVLELCEHERADHTHIFWKCQKLEGYWEGIWEILEEVLGYEIPRIGSVLYLGNLTEENSQGRERYLVKALLATSSLPYLLYVT